MPEEDYFLVKDYYWTVSDNRIIRSRKSVKGVKDKGKALMSIVIWTHHNGLLKGGRYVTTVNGDIYDMRKENLVIEKQRNSHHTKRKCSSSIYSGVHERDGKWVVSLFIGVFKTEIEAAKAFDKVAGQFPELNKQLNFL